MHGFPEDGTEAVADLSSERAQRCTLALMRHTLSNEPGTEGMRLGRVEIAPIDQDQLGAGTNGLRIRQPIIMDDLTLVVNADMLASRRDAGVTSLMTMGLDTRVGDRLRDDLNERAGERLEAALAAE